MEIALRPEHEKLLEKQVESGRFASAADAVGTALELLQYYDPQVDAELKAKLARASAQLDRGEYVELETKGDIATFADEIHRRGLERAKKERAAAS